MRLNVRVSLNIRSVAIGSILTYSYVEICQRNDKSRLCNTIIIYRHVSRWKGSNLMYNIYSYIYVQGDPWKIT